MTEWLNDFKKIGKLVIILISIVLTIFVINQFLTLYQFLTSLHPILAIIVVGGLLIGTGYLIYQVWQQLVNNHPLIEINEDSTVEEVEQYYQDMYQYLSTNPNVSQKLDLSDDVDTKVAVQTYLEELDTLTLPSIIENANAIFLTTAISQNGSLDSFVVLFTMLRMVWQLAAIYKTRPSLTSLLKLYIEVASVILMARTLEDSDLIEYQMEPLITSIIGESIASAIPGMVPISNLVVSSLMEGAINAFLTLRVGIITQDYLKGAQMEDKQTVRRSASMQSFKYMGTIIKSNSKIVIETIAKTVKKAGVDTTKKWFKWGNKVEEAQ